MAGWIGRVFFETKVWGIIFLVSRQTCVLLSAERITDSRLQEMPVIMSQYVVCSKQAMLVRCWETRLSRFVNNYLWDSAMRVIKQLVNSCHPFIALLGYPTRAWLKAPWQFRFSHSKNLRLHLYDYTIVRFVSRIGLWLFRNLWFFDDHDHSWSIYIMINDYMMYEWYWYIINH